MVHKLECIPLQLHQLIPAPLLKNVDIDGLERQEAVDVDHLLLPVATSSTDTLREGCIVLMLARRQKRRYKNDVIRVGQVPAKSLLA